MLVFIVSMILGVGLLAAQQVVGIKFPYLGLPDITLVIFVLFITFGTAKKNKWLFISAFVLGGVVSSWSGRPMGFDSLVYGVPVYLFYSIKETMSLNVLSFILIFLLVFIIKFLLYIIIGFMFKFSALSSFALSWTFVYMFIITFIIGLICYGIARICNEIWGKKYVEQ